MKKGLLLTLMMGLVLNTCAIARTTYDSNGNLINSATLRCEKRKALEKAEAQKKFQAAAAAKLDYEAELKKLDEPQLKSNYYQENK